MSEASSRFSAFFRLGGGIGLQRADRGDLRQRMNSGVGPARAGNMDGLLLYIEEGRFEQCPGSSAAPAEPASRCSLCRRTRESA